MHYAAILGEEEHEIEVVETTPGQYDVVLNGEHIRVDARQVHQTTWHFVIDDHAYNIEFERDPSGNESSENLLVRGETIAVEVLDLRKLRLRQAQGASSASVGPAQIKSPMPGKVVAVLVEDGQEVAEGDGLIVIEAMKMENELRAPKAGVVRQLDAIEGVAVEGSTLLCVVE